MDVQHRRIDNADKEAWVFKFTKPVEASYISHLSYFYSWPPIGEGCEQENKWFQVDSIQVQLTEGKFQTLKIQKHAAGSDLNGLNKPDSKLVDINFDEYPDVDMGLNEVSGNSNELRTYFVFNPRKGKFETGIDLANLGVDNEAKLLYTTWSGGHAGRIGGRESLSFVGYDSIRLDKSVQRDYNKNLEAYTVNTTTLTLAGNYETVVDTMTYVEWE